MARKTSTVASTSLRSSQISLRIIFCHHTDNRVPKRYGGKNQDGMGRPSTCLVQLESLSSVREMQKSHFSRWGCVRGMVITRSETIDVIPASFVCKQHTII